MVDLKNALFILNPAAGSVDDRERLRRALSRAGLPDAWVETTPDRGADEIIRTTESSGPVVVMGGDGTVQEAARALRGGDRPLAIVPLGTGNVMALRLDIPLQLDQALHVVRDGVVRKLDLGMCDGDPFLLTAGMGLDGRLVRESDQRLKKQMGKFAYLWSAGRTLPMPHYDFTLVLDGLEVQQDGASVIVANFGTQVGPWIFPPDSDGGDGVLDVAVLKTASFHQVVSLLAAPFRLKPREHTGVRLFRAASVEVRCSEPAPLQVDGEDWGDRASFVCGIDAASLPVIVSSRRPVLQWSREWPPTGLEWEPWGGDEGPLDPPEDTPVDAPEATEPRDDD